MRGHMQGTEMFLAHAQVARPLTPYVCAKRTTFFWERLPKIAVLERVSRRFQEHLLRECWIGICTLVDAKQKGTRPFSSLQCRWLWPAELWNFWKCKNTVSWKSVETRVWKVDNKVTLFLEAACKTHIPEERCTSPMRRLCMFILANPAHLATHENTINFVTSQRMAFV